MDSNNYTNFFGEDKRMYEYRKDNPIYSASCMFLEFDNPIDVNLIYERMTPLVKNHFLFSIEIHPVEAKWKSVAPKEVSNYIHISEVKLTLTEAFDFYLKSEELGFVVCDVPNRLIYAFTDHTILDGVHGIAMVRQILDPSDTFQPLKLIELPSYIPVITEALCIKWFISQAYNSFYRPNELAKYTTDELLHKKQIWNLIELKKLKKKHNWSMPPLMLAKYLWKIFSQFVELDSVSVCLIAAFKPSPGDESFNSYGFAIFNVNKKASFVEFATAINQSFQDQKENFVHSMRFMEYTKWIPGGLMETLAIRVRSQIDICFTSIPVAQGEQTFGGNLVKYHAGCFGYMDSPLYAIGMTHGNQVFVTTTTKLNI